MDDELIHNSLSLSHTHTYVHTYRRMHTNNHQLVTVIIITARNNRSGTPANRKLEKESDL